ncbi:transposon Ty3-I Gag-Pol polyprotein [Trichonephila clavipes]|nr:transposon Ty3-I Gag-Pol polyprotein [Trichonephila clavipes]
MQDYKPGKNSNYRHVTMRIILKDEEPVCQHPRRLVFTERQEVNKQIEEWLKEGIILPSSSEYASPIVMVKKKNGSSRMCIDYRKLNHKLVKDKFLLTSHRRCFRHFARSKGHVVESGTIKPFIAKALAVQKFPEPTTIKQVQNFLGLTGYFRKYIKDYSTIAKPLSDLARRENPFVLGTLQKEAFEKLKKIMFEGPLLHIY